jgi:predicted nucleic acid-binding protein
MNGRIVLDSNIIMDLFNGKLSKEDFVRVLTNKIQIISVISCIEVMAFPKITGELEKQYDSFLSRRFVIPITEQIKKTNNHNSPQ